MKKSIFVLSLLGVGLFVSGCGNQNTSDSSENSMDSLSSETISSENQSSSVGEEFESEENSSVNEIDVKEQLINYLQTCIETQNYTIVHEEIVRYYLPNAYFCEDTYASSYGYAEDDTGIFSYEIQNGIVQSVEYLKDESDTNIKGLYEYSYGNYSWIEKENYLVNSFAPVSMDSIELTRVKNSKVESYTASFDALCCLLPELHLQNFLSASLVAKTLKGTATLSLLDDGFNIEFYSSATYIALNYEIRNIGTTEINGITEYIENGGVQEENLYTQVLSLFASNRYKVTFENGLVRYVTPNYVVDINGENISGYYLSLDDAMTYTFTITDGNVVLGEAVEISISSYYISSSFLDQLTLDEDKLVIDSYIALQNFSAYFTAEALSEGNYIGKAEIIPSIAFDSNQQILPSDCVVEFVGTEYNGNYGTLLETTYTATYEEFNTASYEIIENYLNGLN